MSAIHAQAMASNLERLRAIEAWALSTLPFQEGDAVVIRRRFAPLTESSGWYRHRGHLVPGATGIVTSIHFGVVCGYWVAMYHPDVEWIIQDQGPHPGERALVLQSEWRHTFVIPVTQLRLRRSSDKSLRPPAGAIVPITNKA